MTRLSVLEAYEIMKAQPRIWKNVLTSFFWARHLSKKAGKLTILDFAAGEIAAGVKVKITLVPPAGIEPAHTGFKGPAELRRAGSTTHRASDAEKAIEKASGWSLLEGYNVIEKAHADEWERIVKQLRQMQQDEGNGGWSIDDILNRIDLAPVQEPAPLGHLDPCEQHEQSFIVQRINALVDAVEELRRRVK